MNQSYEPATLADLRESAVAAPALPAVMSARSILSTGAGPWVKPCGAASAVDLEREQERLVLTVRDNGRGYSPSAESGLGTRLVTTFAAQLGGSASWNASQSGGCTITVVFPAQEMTTRA